MTEQHTAAEAGLAQENDEEISLLDLLQTVADNLRLLVLGPLLAGLAALGISFVIPPTFTASTQFLPPQQQQSAATAMLQSLGALGGLAGAATGLKNPSDQYLAFMKSRTLQDALIQRFGLVQRYEAKLLHDARLALNAKVRISSGKDGLIKVEVDDHDPTFAAELANAHVEELQKLLARLAVTEAQQRRVFFEQQLTQTKSRLTAAEQALQNSGVNASALKASPGAAVEGLARLQAVIAAQEVKLASMRSYLVEGSADFKAALNELGALRRQLNQAEGIQQPARPGDADYIARFREFKYQETLFELFSKQFELAKVDESREGAVIQVLDAATPPERKAKPQKALIAVPAALATGFALLLFVFVRQGLRNAGQDAATAQKIHAIRQAWRRAWGGQGTAA
jgi:tyrosine-protein kinase Etk/Wzc